VKQVENTKKDTQRLNKDPNPYSTLLREASLLYEDKVFELSLLRRVGSILGYILDLELFYRKFIEILLEEINADNCSCMVIDTETNKLVLKMARGRNDDGTFFDHPTDSGVTFSLGEGVAGQAALERETIIIDDVSEDKHYEIRETRFPIGSLLCTPLIFQEKLLGVINLSHSQPYAFNQNNKRIMELLCAFVSTIIGNAIDYIKVKDQEKFKAMFEGVRLSILLIDPETDRIIDCNRYTEEWLGYSKEELVSIEHVFDILPPGYRDKTEHILNEIIEKNRSEFHETPFIRKDGSVNLGEVNGTTINYQGRNVVQVTIRNITERKKAEEALKKSEERYHDLVEFANVGIIVVENDKITQVNRRAEEIYGYPKKELIGQSSRLLTPKKYRKKHTEILSDILKRGKDKKMIFEEEGIRKDGSLFPIEISYAYAQKEENMVIAVMRDITQRKEMEQKLLQSEKLKSLGELAGGVAHDFNNVLAAILGRAQLLKMGVETPKGEQEIRKSIIELKKGLEIIEKAAKDGADTVRRIQEFARKRDEDKYFITIDLNEIIENALEFTRTRWKDDAESKGIKINIQKELSSIPSIAGSASELREVFTNLINNAIDAMPQGGEIKIKTFKEDSHISIKIEDTGCGISKDKRERIFDPFFTTKGVQSTGLGLSVSYGIISRHQGTIRVDSVEDQGTSFIIHLPRTEKTYRQEGSEEKVTLIPREQGKARILVIEDEKDIGQLLRDILADGGHEVETASGGSQGIEIFEKKKDFDIVFTDLGMPGMSGWEVADKVKSINRRVPVALITGWKVELKESELRGRGVDLIIHKPFEVNQVLKLVQEGMVLRDRFKAA